MPCPADLVPVSGRGPDVTVETVPRLAHVGVRFGHALNLVRSARPVDHNVAADSYAASLESHLSRDHTGALVTRRHDDEPVRGWTLYQLRHSALTHDAEQGTSDPMLLARSGHASV